MGTCFNICSSNAYFCGDVMGLSKRDLGKKKASLRLRLEELEKKAKFDPIKKDKRLHEEIAELKKKLGV